MGDSALFDGCVECPRRLSAANERGVSIQSETPRFFSTLKLFCSHNLRPENTLNASTMVVHNIFSFKDKHDMMNARLQWPLLIMDYHNI
jgi:hypothetical protein